MVEELERVKSSDAKRHVRKERFLEKREFLSRARRNG